VLSLRACMLSPEGSCMECGCRRRNRVRECSRQSRRYADRRRSCCLKALVHVHLLPESDSLFESIIDVTDSIIFMFRTDDACGRPVCLSAARTEEEGISKSEGSSRAGACSSRVVVAADIAADDTCPDCVKRIASACRSASHSDTRKQTSASVSSAAGWTQGS